MANTFWARAAMLPSSRHPSKIDWAQFQRVCPEVDARALAQRNDWKCIDMAPDSDEARSPSPVLPEPRASPARQPEELPPVAHNADGEPMWEVKSVIGQRCVKGKREYLVRWDGCSSDEDSWEPAASLKHTAPEALALFLAAPKAFSSQHPSRK
jgi:hypothetical protein